MQEHALQLLYQLYTQTSQGETSKTCVKRWTLFNTVLYERKFVKMELTDASLWRPPTTKLITVVTNDCFKITYPYKGQPFKILSIASLKTLFALL